MDNRGMIIRISREFLLEWIELKDLNAGLYKSKVIGSGRVLELTFIGDDLRMPIIKNNEIKECFIEYTRIETEIKEIK